MAQDVKNDIKKAIQVNTIPLIAISLEPVISL